MEYLSELNSSQREAVETTEGPVLVLAGAGSGKTRVLTYRIVHLLERGVHPWHILALTFTNKAAREMKERIGVVSGDPEMARRLWMGTFHSIFLRILRQHAEAINFVPSFSIYDTGQSGTLLKRIIKSLIPASDLEKYRLGHIGSRISLLKNNLVLPMAYSQDEDLQGEDVAVGRPRFGEIYAAYQKAMIENQAMDFDDILVNTFRLLRTVEEVLTQYQNHFEYILVDEYQDTNRVQSAILRLLAGTRANLCVVGDDAQSIYAFRGAKVDHILQFTKDYPSAKTVKLTVNYRSFDPIVEAANRLISHNRAQIPKECQSYLGAGSPIRVFRFQTPYEEAVAVSRDIKEQMLQKRLTPDQFAILYRTTAQSRLFEEMLRKEDLLVRIYGGVSFYKRKEVVDLLSYFRFLLNPSDEESLLRVINFPPRALGEKSIQVLQAAGAKEGVGLWGVISDLERFPLNLTKTARSSLLSFRFMVNQWREQIHQTVAGAMARVVFEKSGIENYYKKDKSIESEERLQNLHEFLSSVEAFEDSYYESVSADVEEGGATIAVFLDHESLLSDPESESEDDTPRVTLTTVHSAKGLEFDYVYVAGLAEGVFPSFRSLMEANGVEEERRLCYVALTRAAKALVLSTAEQYLVKGRMASVPESRFLREALPEEAGARSRRDYGSFGGVDVRLGRAERAGGADARGGMRLPERPVAPPVNQFMIASGEETPIEELHVGDQVLHGRFGQGVIESMDGSGVDARAVVRFTVMGERTLMLRYAKLKKLN